MGQTEVSSSLARRDACTHTAYSHTTQPLHERHNHLRNYQKSMRSGYGVKRRNINKNKVAKIRNFVHRWNQDEGEGGEWCDDMDPIV